MVETNSRGRPRRPEAHRDNPSEYTTGELMDKTLRQLDEEQPGRWTVRGTAKQLGINANNFSNMLSNRRNVPDPVRERFEDITGLTREEARGARPKRDRGRPPIWQRVRINKG